MESDVLSLSSDLTLQGNTLYDTALGARHELQGAGGYIVRMLQNGISVESLREIAQSHTITDGQLHELLGFLNTVGSLRRRRRMSKQPRALCSQAAQLCLAINYTPLFWRRSVTARYLLLG
ncbi:MAG: hypothetical protein AAB834_01320, partial [Patescibacteria group bacterium]